MAVNDTKQRVVGIAYIPPIPKIFREYATRSVLTDHTETVDEFSSTNFSLIEGLSPCYHDINTLGLGHGLITCNFGTKSSGLFLGERPFLEDNHSMYRIGRYWR